MAYSTSDVAKQIPRYAGHVLAELFARSRRRRPPAAKEFSPVSVACRPESPAHEPASAMLRHYSTVPSHCQSCGFDSTSERANERRGPAPMAVAKARCPVTFPDAIANTATARTDNLLLRRQTARTDGPDVEVAVASDLYFSRVLW